MDKIEVSVILPAYNEEKAIGQVIKDIDQVMSKLPYKYEILVIDDGSKDNTAQIAKNSGARVIKHSINRGVGRARKTGIRNARGEIIIMIDADGSYPVDVFPDMIKLLGTCDMVVGARTRESGSLPWLRKPSKWLLKKIAEIIAGEKIPDLNSGLRAFRKKTAMKFMNILPDTHSWVSTLTLAYLTNEYVVKYIKIPYFKRIGKSTFHPIKDTYNYFLMIIKTMLFFNPLKILMPLAIIITLWGLEKFIYDWQVHNDVRESDIMIILTGLIIAVLSLLADLIISAHKKQYLPEEDEGEGRWGQ